jgi:hypothetical protein
MLRQPCQKVSLVVRTAPALAGDSLDGSKTAKSKHGQRIPNSDEVSTGRNKRKQKKGVSDLVFSLPGE